MTEAIQNGGHLPNLTIFKIKNFKYSIIKGYCMINARVTDGKLFRVCTGYDYASVVRETGSDSTFKAWKIAFAVHFRFDMRYLIKSD